MNDDDWMIQDPVVESLTVSSAVPFIGAASSAIPGSVTVERIGYDSRRRRFTSSYTGLYPD